MPRGIVFHHFHGGAHPTVQGSISAADLDAIVRWIGRDRILDPAEWLDRMSHAALRSGDVCLTLDDSLLCQYDVALPVLEAHGLKAFWFVSSGVFEGDIALFEVHRKFRCTAFADIDGFYAAFFEILARTDARASAAARMPRAEIDRLRAPSPFYSDDDIRFRYVRDRLLDSAVFDQLMLQMMEESGTSVATLAAGLWMTNEHLVRLTALGHAVGLHSYSHPLVIDRLPEAEQALEYERNYDHIRRTCGVAPAAVAHPVNRYSPVTLRILEGLGVRCGFRATMSPPDGGRLNQSALEMAREDHITLLRKVTEATCAS